MVVGAAVVVPAFNLVVQDKSLLGTEKFPVPGSLVWAGVAEMMSKGIDALHPTARWGALCGALLGIVLVLMERWAPKRAKAFIPSPSAFGLAIVIPASSSISFFIGAAVAEWLRRNKPKAAEAGVLPVGSGLIAGESLTGIGLEILKALGFMPR